MSATGTEAPALANDHVQATPVEVPASATARAAAAPPQPPPSGPAAELHAVFPTIDLAVIEAILETHNNDPALCVGDLLAISDPAYTPAAEDDLHSDEQMARRLAQEDQQARRPPGPGPADPTYSNVPYQPYTRRKRSSVTAPASSGIAAGNPPRNDVAGPGGNWSAPSAVGSSQQGTGRDELQKLQEDFNRVAVMGKATVSGWFNQAKVKVRELQQARQEQNAMAQGANPLDTPSQLPADPSLIRSDTPPSGAGLTSLPESSRPQRRSSRLTPSLPYGSRYEKNDAALPSPPASQNAPDASLSSAAPLSTNAQSADLSAHSAAKSPVPAKEAVLPAQRQAEAPAPPPKDEDDLEYVRNPFEDDD